MRRFSSSFTLFPLPCHPLTQAYQRIRKRIEQARQLEEEHKKELENAQSQNLSKEAMQVLARL